MKVEEEIMEIKPVRMFPSEIEKLQAAATKKGMTFSKYVRLILRTELQRNNKATRNLHKR